MDNFGIGAAITASAEIYLRSARQSGRTTRLIENLKDGDRVVFKTHKEASFFSRRIKELGLKVDCVAVPTNNLSKLYERPRSSRRTLFDHGWLEKYYMESIQISIDNLTQLQQQVSGPDSEVEKPFYQDARWL